MSTLQHITQAEARQLHGLVEALVDEAILSRTLAVKQAKRLKATHLVHEQEEGYVQYVPILHNPDWIKEQA